MNNDNNNNNIDDDSDETTITVSWVVWKKFRKDQNKIKERRRPHKKFSTITEFKVMSSRCHAVVRRRVRISRKRRR